MEVKLIDVMGSDTRVADAARVSFHKEVETFGDKDVKLINYLAAHNHFTPFTHVMITMREKVPIFVARQRFKHTIGFSYNEVSRRYVDDTPEFFVPEVWRKRAENKKQGSSDETIDEPFIGRRIHVNKFFTDWHIDYKELMYLCQEFYEKAIEHGVAPEQARMVLPQSLYTEYIVTGSLAAWARAYKLRTDEHAQKEIQDLAVMWNEVIGGIKELQHSWKALID